METHERIKYIRKDCLKLTRDKFGAKLGVSGDVIANIEYNRLARPDQKDPLLKLIAKEFNVNYFWLRDGTGEPFIDIPTSIIDELIFEYELDEIDRRIIEGYMKLPKDKRDVLKSYFKNIFIEKETDH